MTNWDKSMREEQEELPKNSGWKLMANQSLNCTAYMAGKAKQKSVKKKYISDPKHEVNGYRTYLDISMVKRNKKYCVPTNENWRLIVVGTKLQLKFLHFFKMKAHATMQHANLLMEMQYQLFGEFLLQ